MCAKPGRQGSALAVCQEGALSASRVYQEVPPDRAQWHFECWRVVEVDQALGGALARASILWRAPTSKS